MQKTLKNNATHLQATPRSEKSLYSLAPWSNHGMSMYYDHETYNNPVPSP